MWLIKGKGCHIPLQGCRRGAHLPSLGREPVGGQTTKVCDAWPVRRQTPVTFPGAERHRPLAGTKLYCLVTEAHGCEQLAQSCYPANAPAGSRTCDLSITSSFDRPHQNMT